MAQHCHYYYCYYCITLLCSYKFELFPMRYIFSSLAVRASDARAARRMYALKVHSDPFRNDKIRIGDVWRIQHGARASAKLKASRHFFPRCCSLSPEFAVCAISPLHFQCCCFFFFLFYFMMGNIVKAMNLQSMKSEKCGRKGLMWKPLHGVWIEKCARMMRCCNTKNIYMVFAFLFRHW